MAEDQRPVVLLSGGRTTVPLAKPLSQWYRIGVYDHGAIAQFLPHVDPVLSPAAGAGPQLVATATNAVAHITGRIAHGLPGVARRFSRNGINLDGLDTWLPGLSLSILTQVAHDLHCAEAFATQLPLGCVVTHEDVTPQFKALALWAKAKGIPTVHIPHANHFIKTRPDVHDKCVCDWIFATSPWMADWYAERGFPRERIKLTGCPNWDVWHEVVQTISKEHARAVMLLEQDRPVVLYCTSWSQSTNLVDDHTVKDRADVAVLEAAKQAGWQLVIKMHPGEPPDWQKRYAEMAKERGVPALVTQSHLTLSVRAADVLVSVGPSNVIVEAALGDRPSVVVPLRGYGFPCEPPWLADPTPEAIQAAVGRVLDNPQLWTEERGRFVQRFAWVHDGGATRRAAEAVREVGKWQ